MRVGTRALPRLSELVDGVEMTPDMVTRLAALTIMQAHIVADELRDTVIPLLPASKRSFAASLTRRIERGTVLEEDALREFVTFGELLTQQIEAGTHVYWQGEDNHVRGGFEAIHREPEAAELAGSAAELALLGDFVLATLSAARALRETAELIDG